MSTAARMTSLLTTCFGLVACFDATRAPYGASGEQCYVEGLCDSGLKCEDGVCTDACGAGACSGHGTCSFIDNVESCACDTGFNAVGNACVGTSTARVTHAGRDLGAVDVYLSGQDSAVAVNVAFGEAATARNLGPGTYVAVLRRTGLPAESVALATGAPFTVRSDSDYELIISGALSPAANERAITIRGYAQADLVRPSIVHAGGTSAVDSEIAGLSQVSDLGPLEVQAFVGASWGTTQFSISESAGGPVLLVASEPGFEPGGHSLVIFTRAPQESFPGGYALLVLDPSPSSTVKVVGADNVP